MTLRRLVVGFTCVLAAHTTRASAQAMGQTVNGISCDAQEGQRIHIHQHLAIFDHGKAMTIPQYIGIPQASRCIYWLPTHTPEGTIQGAAPRARSSALVVFFPLWGQPLARRHAPSATTKKRES